MSPEAASAASSSGLVSSFKLPAHRRHRHGSDLLFGHLGGVLRRQSLEMLPNPRADDPPGPQRQQQQIPDHRRRQDQRQSQHRVQQALHQTRSFGGVIRRPDAQKEGRSRSDGGDAQGV